MRALQRRQHRPGPGAAERRRGERHRDYPAHDFPQRVAYRREGAPIEITYKQLFAASVTIPLLIGLTWFVSKTRQGKAMRATAQDKGAAAIMGIDVDRTISLTFLLGGVLLGAGGLVRAYGDAVRAAL